MHRHSSHKAHIPQIEDSSNLRFYILEMLSRHQVSKRRDIISLVCKLSGFTQASVYRVISHTWDNPRKVNYEVLKAFAKVWKVPIEELEKPEPMTYQTAKAI